MPRGSTGEPPRGSNGGLDWRDNPQVGMVIRQRNPRYAVGRIPRQIIAVDGDRIETAGMSGDQRNGWMTRGSLRAYELVSEGDR